MKTMLLAAGVSMLAFAAQAGEVVVDGWNVHPSVVNGKLDRCTAASPDGNLGILLFPTGGVSALFGAPESGLPEGPIPVDVDLDRKPAFKQAPSRVLGGGKLLLVTLGAGQQGLDQLGNHQSLTFSTGAKSYTFDVSNLTKPLEALGQCLDDNAGQQ